MVCVSASWHHLGTRTELKQKHRCQIHWESTRGALNEPAELGCAELEWGELNPKLKHTVVGREQRQVPTLAGGEHPDSGLGVVQAQAAAAQPSFHLISKIQAVTAECAHR